MKQVEIKLSEWHRLHKELGTVERMLADALLSHAHEECQRLRNRAAQLTVEANAAMDALHAALLASKAARNRR